MAGLATNVMSVCQPLIVRRGGANGSRSPYPNVHLGLAGVDDEHLVAVVGGGLDRVAGRQVAERLRRRPRAGHG